MTERDDPIGDFLLEFFRLMPWAIVFGAGMLAHYIIAHLKWV